jgi:hypothetical protein
MFINKQKFILFRKGPLFLNEEFYYNSLK